MVTWRVMSPGFGDSVDRGRQQTGGDALVPCSSERGVVSYRLNRPDLGILIRGGIVVEVGRRRRGCAVVVVVRSAQMPVPGKAPFLERTTMPRSREM